MKSYNQNRFSKLFEQMWDKYITVNPTEIVMIGKKTSFMKKVPFFNIVGTFEGWEEKDSQQDILSSNGTIIKLKIKDLINCWSQDDIIDGSGYVKEYKTIIPNVENVIINNLEINTYYNIKIIFKNKVNNSEILVYDDYHNTQKYSYLDNQLELNIKTISPSLYIDYNKNNNEIVEIKYGKLNGAIKCPIDDIKNNISSITVKNRTFKVIGQKINASNVLMIIYLSDNS